MIGNDLVDLHLAQSQSNWKRKGFLEKIFTEEERILIQNSDQKFELVWRLWSMKESVYKVVVQQEQQRFFNPQKLECRIESDTHGQVSYNHEIYRTFTHQTKDYIYSTTSEKATTCLYWLSSKKDRISNIAEKLRLEESNIDVIKDSLGIPNIYYKNKRITKSMTITNHGRFEVLQFKTY